MTTPQYIPSLKYDISGSGTRTPLVLMPGGLTGWLSWIPHAKILANDHKVFRMQLLAVDLGLSGDPLPDNYSVDYEIAALQKTLDELNIQQADFAGWSYGGLITLGFALDHPDRVRSLTLIEPPAFWVVRSQGEVTEELLAEEKFGQSLDVDTISEEQLVGFTHYAGLIPADIDPRSLPQWESWYKHRQSLRISNSPYHYENSIERVRQFNKPVLLIKGENSNPMYHQIIDILDAELPDSMIATYPSGHAPHILSMQPFMKKFTTFLEHGNRAKS